MGDSPAAILYDSNGSELAIANGDALDPNISGIIAVGKDGATARFIKVDANGQPVIVGAGTAGTPSGGIVSVQGVTSGQPVPIIGTVSGTLDAAVLSGAITANQGFTGSHEHRWAVGISDGDDFVGTQANPIKVSNEFSSGEILAQQNGTGTVLTFTFSANVNLVAVESLGSGISRINPFGGNPSATLGIPCRPEEKVEIHIITSSVKVFAPVGLAVNVWGFRR